MPDANTVAIGSAHGGNVYEAGHTSVYTWNGTAWVQKGNDINGEAANDNSGYAVCMPDANTLAIGAANNDGNGAEAGHVRVYNWNGTAWVQKGSDMDGEAAADYSGTFLTMPDANTIAVGAPLNDAGGNKAGHVRIFNWNGTAWVQKGTDINGDAAGDESGSVSMPNANTIAIGTHGNDSDDPSSGLVKIFTWNGTAWVQKGANIIGESNSWSGYAVSMPHVDVVAIGAPFYDGGHADIGTFRIYKWNGSAWVQVGSDVWGEGYDDRSGSAVCMPDANTVAVGAIKNDGNGTEAGHVRVYKYNIISDVAENNYDALVTVNPNPFTKQLFVTLGNNEPATVTLYNFMGQVVLQQPFINAVTIPTNQLTAGIYLYEVRNNKGAVKTGKVLKN